VGDNYNKKVYLDLQAQKSPVVAGLEVNG